MSPLPSSPKGEEKPCGMQLAAEDFQANIQETNTPKEPLPLGGGWEGATLEEIERASIAASIEKHQGNLSLVAKELGISRGALYRKIEKHRL